MTLRNQQELANTQMKLQRLEGRYEALRADKKTDQHVRELSLASLKEMINQLKEEIALYKARHPVQG